VPAVITPSSLSVDTHPGTPSGNPIKKKPAAAAPGGLCGR
jgi:hypothetical protein